MIALVRGTVAVRRADHVVVLAAGVGYRLAVSAETLRHVPAVGKPVALHAHLIVRDDALQLYGFAAEEERDLFLLLIGVQSVGPKVALAVLSGGPPRELLGAVAAGDPIVVVRGDDPRLLARDGLVGLGYSPVEAEQLLEQADVESPEALIAHALKVARR